MPKYFDRTYKVQFDPFLTVIDTFFNCVKYYLTGLDNFLLSICIIFVTKLNIYVCNFLFAFTKPMPFARFPPIKCETYLSQRYKDTHADLNMYNKQQTWIAIELGYMYWPQKKKNSTKVLLPASSIAL